MIIGDTEKGELTIIEYLTLDPASGAYTGVRREKPRGSR